MTTLDQDEGLLHFLYRAPIGLMQIGLDGGVEMINPMSAQLLMPITRTGHLDNLYDALGPAAVPLRSLVDSFAEESGVICEGVRFEIGGARLSERRTFAVSLLKVDAVRLMVVLADVTREVRREQAETRKRLHQAARVDPLTRMPNRVAVAEMIDSILDPASGAANHSVVLLVGCERLQQIAESFGIDVRDRVLALMAKRVRTALRSDGDDEASGVDQLAGRVGTNEFLVVLQQLANRSDAGVVAERIVESLDDPYRVDAHRLHCAVSIGVVHLAEGRGDAEDALRDAAIAMREAGRYGSPRWVEFVPAMRERAIQRGSIEAELREAIVDRQFFVVYQPIVLLQDDGSGRPAAAVEALVRWQHPVRGIVSPVDFIGVAEETGLIAAIGDFVLTTACRTFASWTTTLGERAPTLLAVNLSRAQLSDPRLLGSVRAALHDSGMPADRLQLEVTESLAAQDDGIQAQLHDLKRLGLKLALDDFGTGYSSLSSLHLLPVDTVKIDRSFVTLAESSPHHRVLIEATIKVARSLGMTTVAEGIETDGQAQIVRELGSDKAQGYRYSKPLTEADLGRWIATH